MKRLTLLRLALGMGTAMLAAVPAQAATTSLASVDTSMCSLPTLTQPFLAWGDVNSYTLAPGESADNFAGVGWTLTGGATIKTVTLADGRTGSVLDLPSGSTAVSPPICVSADYPTARTMVRNVVGAEGVQWAVSYAGTKTATAPKTTGQVHGTATAWTLSTPVNMQPYSFTGWQLVQITLTPGGKTSDFQVYNLYVDPRARM